MSNGEHCSLVERRLFGSSLSNNELVLPQGVESEIGTKIGPGALLGPEGSPGSRLGVALPGPVKSCRDGGVDRERGLLFENCTVDASIFVVMTSY